MLGLKLLLVPVFLLLVSLAGKRWGPSVAGWLAGLPVVTGPILFFIAVAHGAGFAADAAVASLSAVMASVSFGVAYAHAAQRSTWPWSLCAGLLAWAVAAWLLSLLPNSPLLSCLVAAGALSAAKLVFPAVSAAPVGRAMSAFELVFRMLAGALLTVVVTFAADALGSRWSGLFAVFPVMGMVLAVFSHRRQGPAFAALLLRAMATGLYSFSAFCLVLCLALSGLGIAVAFCLAVASAMAVQLLTRRQLASSSIR